MKSKFSNLDIQIKAFLIAAFVLTVTFSSMFFTYGFKAFF